MKKAKGLFDHINQITKYKKTGYWENLDEVDKKSWSTYMVNRFLSMNREWCSVISDIQKYNLTPKTYYTLLNNLIPRSNIFLRYIKKNKEFDISENTIEVIAKFFECSKKEAYDYINILNKEQINEIIKSYGVNK